MGREATCQCTVNGGNFPVKAQLETAELILRGGVRCRIPFSQIARVSIDDDSLAFAVGSDNFRLELGKSISEKWAKALQAPPPTLAHKLGIDSASSVRVLGSIDDGALAAALSSALIVTRGKADLIIARVNTSAELNAAFARCEKLVANGAALWIVYRKGSGHAIDETDLRSAGLRSGIVDVKVASVSSELTALKFVRRKAK